MQHGAWRHRLTQSIPAALRVTAPALVVETANRYTVKGGPQLAAALTFFTLFSMAPLLIFVVAVAGIFLGEDLARNALVSQVDTYMGAQVAGVVDDVIEGTQQTTSGTIAILFGLVSIVYGASRLFRGLQGGLNLMWDAEPPPRNPILGILRDRAFSWFLALIAGLSLAVTLALFVAISTLSSSLVSRYLDVGWLNMTLNSGLAILIAALLFAGIYRYVPVVSIAWRDVLPAAVLVSISLYVCARLVGMFFSYAGPGASYIVATAPTVLLIWINISGQIVYVGAAFTYAFANRVGSLAQGSTAEQSDPPLA